MDYIGKMHMIENLKAKLCRKWTKFRLRPIRVFCFHHVSKVFDDSAMWECDWMQIDKFKSCIQIMQEEGVKFVSLMEAYKHIKKDKLRFQRYAVLTFDDGWSSLKEIIPWLCEQRIPVTLFLNPAYIRGESKRKKGTNLTQSELENILEQGAGLIRIASHGWDHTLCTQMSMHEFEQSVQTSEIFLSKYDAYTPYFAYPYGGHTDKQDEYLLARNIIPVYCDGETNYNDARIIHRQCVDMKKTSLFS